VFVFVLALAPTALASTGAQLFAQAGCSGCHTLAAAGASGDGGPNLDQLQPSVSAVEAQVSHGGGGMPSFSGSLSASQIATVPSWVSSVAGRVSRGSSRSSALTPAPVVSGIPIARVRRIQRLLARLGFFHHVVTGYYGPITQAAVAAFQRAVGLRADGIWGPKTADAASKRAAT